MELPDLAAVRAAGIEGLTLEQARLVAAGLSRFIAKGSSKHRTKVNVMGSLLVPACRVEVFRDGECRPPAIPTLPTTGWTNGATAMRQLELGHGRLERYWVVARNRADDACLPLEWLLGFVPGVFWQAVWALIAWGPYEARVRAEEAVTLLARTPIACGTRKRVEGSMLAAGTLESRVDNLWGLMQALVELNAVVRASEHPSLPLEPLMPWTLKPERVDVKACGAKEAHIDTSGPPLPDCAAKLQELYRDWQQAPPHRRFRRHRRLLIHALLTLYGPRREALEMLDIDDYLPNYRYKDGFIGPALRLYPGKTRDPDEAFYLPLPPELAGWIEEWILYTHRQIGQAGSPMWPSRLVKPGQPVCRMFSLYSLIAGSKPYEEHGGTKPLICSGDDPFIGFHPHGYRHTAFQAAKRAGVKVKQARPYEFAHVEPDDFARAVCDHELKQDVSDVYLDLNQQQLARAAVEYAWDDLWHQGKPHGLDPHAINQARHQTNALAAALREREQQLERLYARQTELSERSRALSGDPLNAALIESNRIAAEIHVVMRDANRFTNDHAAAQQRLDQALTTMVVLPDDLSPEQHQDLVAQALGQPAATDLDPDPQLADYLAVQDLADLYATSPQTINNWARNGFPPRRPASWDQGAWVVDGPRSKRLPVTAINHALLTQPQQELLSKLRRQRVLTDCAPNPAS